MRDVTNTQPALSGEQIRDLRERLRYNAVEFAMVMGATSESRERLRQLTKAWEDEIKTPSPGKIRLMLLLTMQEEEADVVHGYSFADLFEIEA